MATILDQAKIDIPPDEIAAFCKRHHIQELSLFGSVLRPDFGPDSDIDVLVEFEPEARIGLKYFKIEDELTELLGRRVDLTTRDGLHALIRNEVLARRQVVYAA
jgi:predicted nucleotidyltransferase